MVTGNNIYLFLKKP